MEQIIENNQKQSFQNVSFRTSLEVVGLESTCQCKRHSFDPCSRKIHTMSQSKLAHTPQLLKPEVSQNFQVSTELSSRAAPK